MLPTAVVICAGLLVVSGCQRADRAIGATPSRAELPNLEGEYVSALAIGVGVEGAGDERGILMVPKCEKIEPTPEEREVLGEKEEPELDALALYRPPRGPQHGVSAEAYQSLTGVGGIGGAGVGLSASYPRYGVLGYAGRNYGIALSASFVSGVGTARAPGADGGANWDQRVGEGRAREPMQRAKRHYP